MYNFYAKGRVFDYKWAKVKRLYSLGECYDFIKFLTKDSRDNAYKYFIVKEGEDWKLKFMQSEGMYDD